VIETPGLELLLLHCHLGHIPFIMLGKLYPKLYSRCSKAKLVCDACEFAKHTTTTYSSVGNRSSSCFDIIHSDVWEPSRITSLFGSRWFVTFIDCHSRMTWLYLLRSKMKFWSASRFFIRWWEHNLRKKMKVLRSDNDTEYTNRAMQDFLRDNDIVHQTTCVNTPEQNGVAERKNRHILEVTRCLLFSMNVPKYLWGEAAQTTTYLINRISLRTVDFSTPFEMLTGTTSFKVPPKKFGCVCFVHNTSPGLSKFDAQSHKCVFVGYSSGKKGYKCYDPVKKRMFESLVVTFKET
jgi:Integrase core domain